MGIQSLIGKTINSLKAHLPNKHSIFRVPKSVTQYIFASDLVLFILGAYVVALSVQFPVQRNHPGSSILPPTFNSNSY